MAQKAIPIAYCVCYTKVNEEMGAVQMMQVNNFLLQGVEYMIWDAAAGKVPGAAGIALLLDRRLGVGADQLLVMDAHRVLRAFAADGSAIPVSPAACFAAAVWCGRQGRAAEAAALLHQLTVHERQALVAAEITVIELHLTDFFCRQLAAAEAFLYAAAV